MPEHGLLVYRDDRRGKMHVKMRILAAAMLGAATMSAQAGALDDLLASFRQQGAGEFSADAGKALWVKSFPSPEGGPDRRCATCHTEDLKATGKHATTGKAIDPLAPSVNAKRLTDRKEMEKWLARNCKWVLGRECTPQEKGDALAYIRQN
jgi:hypothetical protein